MLYTVCIFDIAFCGLGHCCHYGEITLLPGQSYENTTGPYCYQCICSGDGDSLRCCGWVKSN